MTDRQDRIAVFLGPSLPLAAARQILPARYLPPARFGDVYRLIGGGVDTVVLIDGVFHGETPVWPRELLAAVRSGIRVFGAASMGAIRAAELHPHGMIGLGTVFRSYADGEIDGDDEVALLHTGPEQGYSALSMPLVGLRLDLREASARGVLSPEAAAGLLAAMKALPFWQRTLSELWSTAAYEALDDATRAELKTFLAEHAIDVKRRDAAEALAEVARRLAEPPGRPIPDPADGGYHDRFRLLRREIPRASGEPLDGEAVVRRAFSDPGRRRRLQAALAARFFTREWAREAGVSVPAGELRALSRERRGRAVAGSIEGWLRANALSAAEHEDLLARHLLWTWVLSGDAGRFGLSPALSDAACWPFGPETGVFRSIADPAELSRALPHVAAWCRVTGASPGADVESAFRERSRDALRLLRARGAGAADEDDYVHALWALHEGPIHFGFATWSPAAELIRELQISGALGALSSRWEEEGP